MFGFGGRPAMALYKTYQDVRTRLFQYTIVLFNVAGFLSYFFILSPSHQAALTALASKALSNPLWSETLKGSLGIGLFTGLAYLLVEIFKVHDHVYDKYVVRWRLRYDTDFILPRLCRRFLSRMGVRFFEQAAPNLYAFMNALFYPYVQDYKEKEPRIDQNYLVRFYERVTGYWMTQMNEITLVALALLVLLYGTLWNDGTAPARLFWPLVSLMLLFALNRLLVGLTRESVRQTTSDEIEAILERHEADLEDRLRVLCRNYDIPF
jgi:hypothetical protein